MDHQFVIDNLCLVKRVIRRYRMPSTSLYPLDEMIADGYLALCHAAEAYQGQNFLDMQKKAYRAIRNKLFEKVKGLRKVRKFNGQTDLELGVCQEETNLGEVERLDEAIKKLPEEEIRALRLRFYQNLEYRKIGELTGKGESGAWKGVDKAVKHLREILISA